MTLAEYFTALAQAQDANVCGCAVLDAAATIQAGWNVVTRADGLRVRLDTVTGAAPLPAATDAVTNAAVDPASIDAQAKAETRSQANSLLLAGADSTHVGNRAADVASWTFGVNDTAECLWAAFTIICQRAGIALPTDSEIADQITTLRAGVDPGVPAADVAARGHIRRQQPDIVQLISSVIAAGLADPQ